MALKRINIYGQIKSCSIYPVIDGVASETPAAIDATITLPAISFESSTVQMMGPLTVPDQSRLGDLSLSITVSQGKESMALSGKGLKSYAIRWVQEVTEPSGAVRVVGFVCYASGYVTQVPESAKNPGAEGTSDYNVSLVKYRVLEDGKIEHFNIDRAAGKLVINGEDYRSEVDDLL